MRCLKAELGLELRSPVLCSLCCASSKLQIPARNPRSSEGLDRIQVLPALSLPTSLHTYCSLTATSLRDQTHALSPANPRTSLIHSLCSRWPSSHISPESPVSPELPAHASLPLLLYIRLLVQYIFLPTVSFCEYKCNLGNF